MMVLFIILGVLGFIASTIWLIAMNATAPLLSKHKYGVARRKYIALSWPAQQIVEDYAKVPAANRPYANIEYLLSALDIKHGRRAVNNHFAERCYGRGGSGTYLKFSWKCGCYQHRPCTFPEYKDLYKGIILIQESLAKQAHAMKISGVADGLTAVEDLTERLRQENELINTVTKELT